MSDDRLAPKQLKWTDPENLFITANRLKREGYTMQEIADAMELSIAAVDRILNGRAMRQTRST